MKVVTPEEMSALDRCTIASGTPSYTLMERAGGECADIILEKLRPDDKTVVVCGTGNNGGDGQVIARLLHRNKKDVKTVFTANQEKAQSHFTPDAKKNYELLLKEGVPVNFAGDEAAFQKAIKGSSVIIDAVFGTGLQDKPLPAYYTNIFKMMNDANAQRISIDIPSGLNGTTGKDLGGVQADATIIIQCVKTGELLGDGPDLTGDRTLADIGIDEDCQGVGDKIDRHFLSRTDLCFPIKRKKNSYKYHYGSILTIAGSKGMLGAGALAAGGALRMGAGLVTNYVHNPLYSAAVSIMPPESIVRSYAAVLTMDQLKDIKRDVILFGPGIGRHTDYAGLLEEMMNADDPLVIDADGLWMLHRKLEALKKSKVPVILTPHAGEFAALLGISNEELNADLLNYAVNFATEYQVTLVLKGHHTLVVSSEGTVWFNSTGNAGMATPGAGDVLSGMVAAVMAQIKDPVEAAKAAVYYHGMAGDWYADHYNQTTLLAGDIINSLREVMD